MNYILFFYLYLINLFVVKGKHLYIVILIIYINYITLYIKGSMFNTSSSGSHKAKKASIDI